jgi:arylsulfatase A-like enzyme
MCWVLLLLATAVSPPSEPVKPNGVVLITLDTTRADAVGFSGSTSASTPTLDRLAALGVHYETAVSPAPLTLPSHATLLTGLDPPGHGVRSNGGEVLRTSLPTMASVLSENGWNTAAVVGSRVLDRRFGLDRGFAVYDDSMAAEHIGQYGYPERDARAVTDAALQWFEARETGAPFFLWVHYYDPHAPYDPPAGFGGSTELAAYLGEVSFVDQQIGRLLRALPGGLEKSLVVVVGDHGEALGDHGEQTHGVFLYRATLEVPLLIAGPGVPAGRSIATPVALRQVAPTILQLAGAADNEIAGRNALPIPGGPSTRVEGIYAEATMPETAYGWAPLRCVVTSGLKYIDAPRHELYDLDSDPGERRNLAADRPDDALALAAMLAEQPSGPDGAPPDIDPETREALRSLGYVGGTNENDGLDPKDGIVLLGELEAATRDLRSGKVELAVQRLEKLVQTNPSNAVLQTRLGEALRAAGEGERSLAAYRRAVALQPRSEFARRNLGHALASLGLTGDARAVFREALEINSRWAPAWLGLADVVPPAQQQTVLQEAVLAGTESATVYLRLAETQLSKDPTDALATCDLIAELSPSAPEGALCFGRAWLAAGDRLKAAPHLRRATVLGRGTEIAAEAKQFLEQLDSDTAP